MRGAEVLFKLSLIERGGHCIEPYLDALGVDRGELDRDDAWVEWDPFARFMDDAIDRIGRERVRALAIAHHTPPRALPKKERATSLRQCLTELAASRQAACPPHRYSFEAHGDGFATFTHEIPAPLFVSAGLFEAEAIAVEQAPRARGLAPARLLDVWVHRCGRRAQYFLELPDEIERPPLGPLGDAIEGIAIIGTLDMAELVGVDPSPWLARHGLSRSALLGGRRVRWDALRELYDQLGARADDATLRGVGRQFAALTREIRPMVEGLPNLVEIYRALHGDAIVAFWGPLAPVVVRSVRPGVLAIRLMARRGLGGSQPWFALHAGTLEGLTAHRDLPPATVRALHLDDGAAIALFVVDLPAEPIPVAERTRPGPTAGLSVDGIADQMFRDRHAARAEVVERLGRELAARADVHDVAEAVLDALAGALGSRGVQIELCTGEAGRLIPIRARGRHDGAPLERSLHYGGQLLGRLRVWTTAATTGEALAALDVVVPWIAVAFGTALERAQKAAELRAAHAAREGSERALNEVLAVHPRATFLLDATGHVTPMNDRARAQLDDDPTAALARIATAVGEPEPSGFDVLPVEIAGHTDRIVVIERAEEQPPFEATLERAAVEWALTSRQREVLDRVARGMSNKEIANDLGCAEVTVENHLTTIYRKAGVDGRNRLIASLTRG